MLTYKGYTGKVEFDDQAGILHGDVLYLRDVITFQGTSVEEVRQAFHDAIDDYLDWCAERSEEAEKPFSGKFMLRVDRDLHRDVVIASNLAGLSLNAYVAQCLREAVAKKPVPRPSLSPAKGIGKSGKIEATLTLQLPPMRIESTKGIGPQIQTSHRWKELAFSVPVEEG